MAEADAGADEGLAVTHDTFFGGRLKLAQPARGHRSGTDAVLLAAAVPRDFSGLVYDAGAGVGAVGLGIALLCPGARVRLIERDPLASRLAEENIVSNGLGARAGVASCDVLSVEARRACLREPAALVVTNPPFYEGGMVRQSPDEGRRAAHVMEAGASLADWISACVDLLAAKGTLILLHVAAALPAILRAISGQAAGITTMAVHPRKDLPASRCLIRARKGSRAPFALAPPLILHESDGFTPETDAIHAGEATLRW